MLADVHMTGYPYPDSETSVYWHRDGVFVIFPISPGRYRVIADLPPAGTEHPPTPTLEQVQAIIDRRGPSGLKAFDPIWLAGFRINGRKVASYRWGRVFLAGDAAHVHSPAGGQGMNTGMQDAFNLAWKLALVVRKTCDEHLLDSYSPERSGVGDQVLKAADRLTAIGTMKNPLAQTVRNLVGHVMLGLSPVRHAIADTMTEVTIGYPDSPLNGPSLGGAGPRPGERVVPIAGQVPVGSGDTPRFALFADKTAATVDLIRRFGGLLDPDIRPPFDNGGIWLVDLTATLRVRPAMQTLSPATLAASFDGACRSGRRGSAGVVQSWDRTARAGSSRRRNGPRPYSRGTARAAVWNRPRMSDRVRALAGFTATSIIKLQTVNQGRIERYNSDGQIMYEYVVTATSINPFANNSLGQLVVRDGYVGSRPIIRFRPISRPRVDPT